MDIINKNGPLMALIKAHTNTKELPAFNFSGTHGLLVSQVKRVLTQGAELAKEQHYKQKMREADRER